VNNKYTTYKRYIFGISIKIAGLMTPTYNLSVWNKNSGCYSHVDWHTVCGIKIGVVIHMLTVCGINIGVGYGV
jgi:hypothetical protein